MRGTNNLCWVSAAAYEITLNMVSNVENHLIMLMGDDTLCRVSAVEFEITLIKMFTKMFKSMFENIMCLTVL